MEKLVEEELRKGTPSPTPASRPLGRAPEMPAVSRLPVSVRKPSNRTNLFPAEAPILPPPRVPIRNPSDRYPVRIIREIVDTPGKQSSNIMRPIDETGRDQKQVLASDEQQSLGEESSPGGCSKYCAANLYLNNGATDSNVSSNTDGSVTKVVTCTKQASDNAEENLSFPQASSRFSKDCAANFHLPQESRSNDLSVNVDRQDSKPDTNQSSSGHDGQSSMSTQAPIIKVTVKNVAKSQEAVGSGKHKASSSSSEIKDGTDEDPGLAQIRQSLQMRLVDIVGDMTISEGLNEYSRGGQGTTTGENMNLDIRSKIVGGHLGTYSGKEHQSLSNRTTLSGPSQVIPTKERINTQQEPSTRSVQVKNEARPVFGPERPSHLKIPLGFRSDIVEFDKFIKLFEHSLPLDIHPFAVIVEFDVTAGIAFIHDGRMYVALGQNWEIRRITKPSTPKELLDILKDHSFNEGLVCSPGVSMHKFMSGQYETMIELVNPEEIATFHDRQRNRMVAVTNVHKYAVNNNGRWCNYQCNCEICLDRRVKSSG